MTAGRSIFFFFHHIIVNIYTLSYLRFLCLQNVLSLVYEFMNADQPVLLSFWDIILK